MNQVYPQIAQISQIKKHCSRLNKKPAGWAGFNLRSSAKSAD